MLNLLSQLKRFTSCSSSQGKEKEVNLSSPIKPFNSEKEVAQEFCLTESRSETVKCKHQKPLETNRSLPTNSTSSQQVNLFLNADLDICITEQSHILDEKESINLHSRMLETQIKQAQILIMQSFSWKQTKPQNATSKTQVTVKSQTALNQLPKAKINLPTVKKDAPLLNRKVPSTMAKSFKDKKFSTQLKRRPKELNKNSLKQKSVQIEIMDVDEDETEPTYELLLSPSDTSSFSFKPKFFKPSQIVLQQNSSQMSLSRLHSSSPDLTRQNSFKDI